MKKIIAAAVFFVLLTILSGCAQKETLTGTFIKDKGCMGIVNDVLLVEFSNKCDEAEKFNNKKVEVVGKIKTYFPDGLCPDDYVGQVRCDAKIIKKVKSIKIIE